MVRPKNVTVVKSVILTIVISPGQSDFDQETSCCDVLREKTLFLIFEISDIIVVKGNR